jgi:hypothetical protein
VETAAPAAMVPLYEAFLTVTAEPDCDQVPFQPLLSFWLPE